MLHIRDSLIKYLCQVGPDNCLPSRDYVPVDRVQSAKETPQRPFELRNVQS